LAQPRLITAGEGEWDVGRNSESATVFWSVLLEVRTAIVMEGFGTAIAVEEIVFVVFVAETSSNMDAPSSFFSAVAAAVISYMVWVRFIFSQLR